MIRRPVHLRRSWLFLPGADPAGLQAGAECAADVVVQELEDFTPPARRPEARALAPSLYPAWRAAGRIAGVRVTPLEEAGEEDLAAVREDLPDLVMYHKVHAPANKPHRKRSCEGT